MSYEAKNRSRWDILCHFFENAWKGFLLLQYIAWGVNLSFKIISSIFLSLGTWRIWGAWSGHFFIIWSFTDKCTPNSWGASWFEGISGSETQQFEMWTNFMQNCLKVMWLTLVVVSFEAVWKAGPVPSPLELVQLTSEVLSCENGRRFEA